MVRPDCERRFRPSWRGFAALFLAATAIGLLILIVIVPPAPPRRAAASTNNADDGRGSGVSLRPVPALSAPSVDEANVSLPAPCLWAITDRYLIEQEFLDRLLDAIWAVETRRGRDLRRGDGGEAAGHLQQHADHWRRGCAYLGVRWPWPQATRDVEKCRHVAVANWMADPVARSFAIPGRQSEYLARSFRLPASPWREDNDRYWRRVKAAMEDAP